MNIAMTLADLRKWIAWGPVRVTSLHGMNNQAAAVYIQLHEVPPLANGTLSAGAVPTVKSLQCAANAPFYFSVDFTLKELFLALSSTEVNYTAVAANGGLDMMVVVDSDFLCDGTEVVVGDLTTPVKTLQVWTEANGPKALLRLDVQELLEEAHYIVIQATDADANVPRERMFPLDPLAHVVFNFGTIGLNVSSKDAGQTYRKGCTIRVVDSTIFAWNQSDNVAYIRAIYK